MFDWIHGNSRLPLALSTVELLVDMDCQGCERKVRCAISKLDGVDTVEIDVDRQKVTVTGYVDREDVLKIVKRTGRATEFWPFTYNGYYGDYYTNPSQYLEEINFSDNTFSYNGKYDSYDSNIESKEQEFYSNGYYHRSSRKVNENGLHLFSDDNVNACTIM